MSKVFAIGDIHGCIKSLKTLLSRISPQGDDTLVFLGDYVSKGSHPKEALDYIFQLKENYQVVMVRGNHDQKLLNFLESPEDKTLEEDQRTLGNTAFLNLDSEVSQKYILLLHSLPVYHETDSFLFVHAGFDFTSPSCFSDSKFMMETRSFAYNKREAKGKKILHGHVPVSKETTQAAINQNLPIIPLDNGCVFKDQETLGHLTCLDLESMQLIHQANCED